MLRRLVVLLALPVAGLFAQGTEVQVRISAANNAAYRIVGGDSSRGPFNTPLIARGTTSFNVVTLGGVTIAAVDSVSRIHIEASENGRLVATADGPFVAVRRDSSGHVMVEARGSIPPDSALFRYSRRRPPSPIDRKPWRL